MTNLSANLRTVASLPRVRFWARLVIGLAISLVCLVLVLRGADLNEVGAALGRTNPAWLVPAALALAASIVVKALRWGLLFRPHHRPAWRPLTASVLVGQMVNNALPVRLGEVARIQFLSDSAGIPRTFSLGTVALEKALDSVSLLGLFIIVVPFALLPEWVKESGLLVTAATGILLAGALLIVSRRGSLRLIAESLADRVPPLSCLTESRRVTTILQSMDVLGHAGLLAQAFGYSALALLFGALVNLCVLLALGLRPSIPAALFVLLIGYLGGTVPASPGRIGIFQWVTLLSLAPFGYEHSAALSYSVLLYGVVIVLPTVAGVLVIGRQPFSLFDGKDSSR